jgi:hypothetical protein
MGYPKKNENSLWVRVMVRKPVWSKGKGHG